MNKVVLVIIAAILITLLISCKEKEKDPGNLWLTFDEKVNSEPLQTDTLIYINEAGNLYQVSEIQYFISKFTFYYHDGKSYTVKDNMGIHYIDSDIPESRFWYFPDDIPAGQLDSIVFIFGLDEADNQSNIFPNPPESNMFWPDELGGGYHYMKLNGKYQDTTGLLAPFNFHLGIGQTYDTTGQVTGFVQNYFKVNFPFISYSSLIVDVVHGQDINLIITMNIESWFSTPNTWDFNYWGGMMMQNQAALESACENGRNAFSISAIHAE